MSRVVNRNDITGNSGDAPHPALDGRLNLLTAVTCIAISPDQKTLYVADWGNKRLRSVYCPDA